MNFEELLLQINECEVLKRDQQVKLDQEIFLHQQTKKSIEILQTTLKQLEEKENQLNQQIQLIQIEFHSEQLSCKENQLLLINQRSEIDLVKKQLEEHMISMQNIRENLTKQMNQAKIRYDQVKEFVNKQKSTMDLNVLEENIKILQLKVQQIENSMSKRNQLFIEQQKLIEKRSKSKEKLFRLNQSIQSKHSFHFENQQQQLSKQKEIDDLTIKKKQEIISELQIQLNTLESIVSLKSIEFESKQKQYEQLKDAASQWEYFLESAICQCGKSISDSIQDKSII